MDFEAMKARLLAQVDPEQVAEVQRKLREASQAAESLSVVVGDVVSNVARALGEVADELSEFAGTDSVGTEDVTLEQKFQYVYERLESDGTKQYYLANKDSLLSDFAWVVENAYEFFRNEESGR